MKQKKTKGSSFRGLLAYLLKEKGEKEQEELAKGELQRKELTSDRHHVRERVQAISKEIFEEQKRLRGRIVGGNMDGQTIDELTEEFESMRALRPEIAKPVDHVSLSAAKGEQLSDDTWRKLTYIYNKKTGFERSMYVAIKHEDTNIDHIHIARSRIDFDGNVISDSNDYQQGEKAVQYIERKFKLQESVPSKETMRRAPTRGELEQEKKTGKRSIKSRLQDLVDFALTGKPTVTQLIKRLEAANVEVSFRLKDEGPTGIIFRLDGEVMKGADLGRAYSWPGIQKSWPGHSERGLSYEYKRDLPAIHRATERVATRSNLAADKGREEGRTAGLDQGRPNTATDERDSMSARGVHPSNTPTQGNRNFGSDSGDHEQNRGYNGLENRAFGSRFSTRDRSLAQSEDGTDHGFSRDPARGRGFPPRAGEGGLDGQEDIERIWAHDGRGEESAEVGIRDSSQALRELTSQGMDSPSPSSSNYDYRGYSQRVLGIIDDAANPKHDLERGKMGDLHGAAISRAKEEVGGCDRQDNSREEPPFESIEVNDVSQSYARPSPTNAFERPNVGKEDIEMAQALDDLIL